MIAAPRDDAREDLDAVLRLVDRELYPPIGVVAVGIVAASWPRPPWALIDGRATTRAPWTPLPKRGCGRRAGCAGTGFSFHARHLVALRSFCKLVQDEVIETASIRCFANHDPRVCHSPAEL